MIRGEINYKLLGENLDLNEREGLMCNWLKKLTIKTLSLSLLKAGWKKEKKKREKPTKLKKIHWKKTMENKGCEGWRKLLHTTS